ncbi:cobalamin synthase [Amycolatopsis bartoniae]|uniref:Membrane protein n=1 Tax=Amycolatopsis bartoniae TaxID=941986 RepID=A0A8H9M7I3_9PSEU|nr:DUF3180 domain-containing protein [Amycolatopsis bartoniae]MBB2935138.1 cobalamin synthase [Amycolatopsis bartoniae]TVT07014.1 DUF3180 domain-containing protein [Amycolatopsis bartoniae]GHF74630.1 membrane protein [Amycolatopsis bartoniae]
MHFTRPRELVTAGLVGLVLAYLVFRFAYGSLPPLPRYAGVTLLVLAVVEAVLAFSVRARIRSGRLTGAIGVARAVALAKASSLLGALMLGAWLGALAALLPRADEVAAAANDVRSAIIGAVCAVVLIAAALWLEHCCRTPETRDQDRDDHPTG